MTQEELINITKKFARECLENLEGGHDWFHTLRVYNNALHIAKYESVDILVVSLAALLHDIADSKFYDGDETIGPKTAKKFLIKHNVSKPVLTHVVQIIANISFKNSFDKGTKFTSKELEVVRDADRLDAIGAIGIARCFNYGGYKNRPLYDPNIPPDLNLTKDAYKAAKAPTINHFYEKLLLLKSQMHTKTAQDSALKRHEFMERFLIQFYAEFNTEI